MRNPFNFSESIKEFLVEKTYQCELFIQFSKLITHNKFRTVNIDLVNKREELISNIREEKHMGNMITREDIENLKNEKLTINPSDIDYPYLAGLIDSEGCFRIKKWKPKNRPNEVSNITVEIGNTKLPIMPWLVKRFGGSVVFIEARKINVLLLLGLFLPSALYKILPKIRCFLRNKQEVCDKLIEFQQTILPNGGDRNSELFKALFEKRRGVRERIIQEIHQLNHKGSI